MALLGEKIAQLFDTAPEPDPENAFDDETIAKNENIDTGISVDTHSSRLRDIDLGDSYKGEVISRDQLNQWNDDDIDDEDIDIEDQDPDSGDSGDTDQPLRVIPTVESSEDDIDDGEDDDIMDEDEFDTVFEKKNDYLSQYNFRDDSKHKHQLSRFGEDNDKFNEDDDEDEEDEFEDMMNRQMDEVNELQEASKKLTINKTEPRPQTHQIRKAKAVASQTKLYDKVATLRIHLQKPFQIAQKLPRPSAYVELMDNVDGEGKGENNEDFCFATVVSIFSASPMSWYYAEYSGTTQGPISITQMKSLYGSKIKDTTYLWNGTTVTTWTALNKLPDIHTFSKG